EFRRVLFRSLAQVLIDRHDRQEYASAIRAGNAELALSTQLLEQRLSEAQQLAITLALDHSITALLSDAAGDELSRINRLFFNLTENLNINQVFYSTTKALASHPANGSEPVIAKAKIMPT